MNQTSDRLTGESRRLIAQHHASQGKRYAKAVALIALSVICGAVIGVGGTVLYFKKKMHKVPPRPDAIAQYIIDNMHTSLKLTAGEEEQIKSILDTNMREVETIRNASFDEMHTIFDKMNAEVDAILGPDRAKAWEEFKEKSYGPMRRKKMKERREREMHDRERRGPPPPHRH